MFRLNYGNGQVSDRLETLRAARDAYRAQIDFDRRTGQSAGYLCIQRYVGDDAPDGWITVRPE